MARISKRKENHLDDRDKTLEPEKPHYGLSKSATTILSLTDKGPTKERTPYRLSQRNKYLDSYSDTKLLERNSSFRSSKQKTERELSRIAEPYDHNNYSRYDHYYSSSNKTKRDQLENGLTNFKSKYDPDVLSSEIKSTNSPNASSASNRRQLKSYRSSNKNSSTERRNTTNYKLLPIDIDNDAKSPSSTTSKYSRGISSSSSSTYSKNKSNPRISQTQKFFDSENIPSSRVSATNNNFLSSDEDKENDGELSEREAKRKEIRSLIMKYAQLDDNYCRTADENNNKVSTRKGDASAIVGSGGGGGKNGYSSSNASSASAMGGAGKIVSYGSVRKTASSSSVNLMQRHQNSRIPKAFHSFVRFVPS